jgi:E3 ubiquitin-protein ligase NEDD4
MCPATMDKDIVQLTFISRTNEDGILAVQVFDQKKFKKKDQGFLGVINIRVGDVIPELSADADGQLTYTQARNVKSPADIYMRT